MWDLRSPKSYYLKGGWLSDYPDTVVLRGRESYVLDTREDDILQELILLQKCNIKKCNK